MVGWQTDEKTGTDKYVPEEREVKKDRKSKSILEPD